VKNPVYSRLKTFFRSKAPRRTPPKRVERRTENERFSKTAARPDKLFEKLSTSLILAGCPYFMDFPQSRQLFERLPIPDFQTANQRHPDGWRFFFRGCLLS
jgi:hypothetical protein